MHGCSSFINNTHTHTHTLAAILLLFEMAALSVSSKLFKDKTARLFIFVSRTACTLNFSEKISIKIFYFI